ncbi:hypothetical protein [Pontibacter ramchanderi]|uniref:Uncharacterized protein n=1 Tax=Pontibacter ramchanderi TaxID=1179743 RepID=A0A2N3V1M9_9BACT|nr:hypothetical protein [Pontibacter ramchanderi]PKV75539.1 hypothetical protein BD749_0482 [Pontibacter ramchanderi]
MKLLFIMLMVVLPTAAFSQEFRIKINGAEFPTDKIPEHVTFPQRVAKILIKKEKPDPTPRTFIVQIGEEEHSFKTDGTYQEVEFSHDVRDLVIYILGEKRENQGKPFILNKPR